MAGQKEGGNRKPARNGFKILFGLFFIIFTAAMVYLGIRYFHGASEEREAARQQELYESVQPNIEDAAVSATGGYLDEALALNPDTVAWLTIPDTVIDFPIVQSEDNDFYLTHGFDGSEYARGCPFLDYRCSSDFTDFNSIIYGHHIRNGQVFSGLEYFREQEYFDEHREGQLVLPDEILSIHFIACVVVESDSFLYSVVHPGVSDRLLYLNTIKEQAAASTDFAPEELTEANLIVLSTCSYDYDGARTALVGVLVDEK